MNIKKCIKDSYNLIKKQRLEEIFTKGDIEMVTGT